MHLHAYSKASYQTHTNTLCHQHELQIISGTSVQIRTEKQIFPGRESEKQNRREGRTESKLLARWCDCSAAAVVHRSQTGRIFSKQTCVKIPFKMLCFVFKIYLVEVHLSPAQRTAEQHRQVSSQNTLKSKCWGEKKIEFDFKSAQQHRLATRTATTGEKSERFIHLKIYRDLERYGRAGLRFPFSPLCIAARQ